MTAKILVVEDNENNGYLVRFLLEGAGYAVTMATNGRQALRIAERDIPDLILLDIQMPEMDGYETARRLQTDSKLSRIPILGVTSYAMTGDRDRALAVGFAGYIQKPIEPERFVAQVAAFLDPAIAR